MHRVRTIHKKTGPDRFRNFMSPGPAESVPGPLVTNGNAVFPAVDGGNQLVIQSCSIVTDGIGTGSSRY